MKSRLIILIACFALHSQVFAQVVSQTIHVKGGDIPGLIKAINDANAGTGPRNIEIIPGDDLDNLFVFTEPAAGFDSALPDITSDIRIFGGEFRAGENVESMLRMVKVTGGQLNLSTMLISGFGTTQGDGGAILVQGDGRLVIHSSLFNECSASGNGGAIAGEGNASVKIVGTIFVSNIAGRNGGAITFKGNAVASIRSCRFDENSSEVNGGAINSEGSSLVEIDNATFVGNTTRVFGCDVNVSSNVPENTTALEVRDSHFSSMCSLPLFENPFGPMRLRNNTFYGDSDIIDSTDVTEMQGNIFHIGVYGGEMLNSGPQPPRKEALCNDFGSNAFVSLGYNIASDDSCDLDQETDLPGVDPMIALDEDGLYQPLPGSPVIDAGPSEAVKLDGDELVSLPCGYRDITGTARPQDGNGDGVFECDMGALEVQGSGDIVAGHSGAFFNGDRDGEGTFVEILNDTLALVYTFTYRPDGSGPAWMVGLGSIKDNAIVIDELTRPVGTSFGTGFNADDVVRTPAGGMSMVFPDCTAADPGGNVAYEGDSDLGYEGLITRATRLSNVTGCDAGEAHENVGLSGSYFDPDRDGEGIITQWFSNGNVLVVFFTYDQNDNQMWVLGVGTPNGKSVTINARYPSSYSQWGSGFVVEDAIQSDWGTFTLNWTDCNSVTFDYSSTVTGFGSASRNYTRLSTLQATSCPDF